MVDQFEHIARDLALQKSLGFVARKAKGGEGVEGGDNHVSVSVSVSVEWIIQQQHPNANTQLPLTFIMYCKMIYSILQYILLF